MGQPLPDAVRELLDDLEDPVVLLEYFAERGNFDDGVVELTFHFENGTLRAAKLGPRHVGRSELAILAR